MTRQEMRILGGAAGLLAIVALVPLLGREYWTEIAVNITMYAALATSWALFSGPTRYISLATGAFFGLGAYIVGVAVSDYQVPFFWAALAAPFAGAVLALLIGLATLRLSGVYFVIFTLGLAEMLRNLVSWAQGRYIGSSSGLYVYTDLTTNHILWLLLAIAAAVVLLGVWIARSRLGFALRIIGDDELVARHVGIDTAWSKIVLFSATGFFAALIGAVIAPRYAYIDPNGAFSPELSFTVAIMALLGGLHRLWGPAIGVVAFTLISELTALGFPNAQKLILGVAFLLIVYFIPSGVVGLAERFIGANRK